MLISELAQATNETSRTLRFYEAAGLIAEPPRTPGNYRNYPDSTIGRVRFIRSLQSAGLTLDDIATITHILDSATPPTSTDIALLEATLARIDNHLGTLDRTHRDLQRLAHPDRQSDRTLRRGRNQTDRITRQEEPPSCPATHSPKMTT